MTHVYPQYAADGRVVPTHSLPTGTLRDFYYGGQPRVCGHQEHQQPAPRIIPRSQGCVQVNQVKMWEPPPPSMVCIISSCSGREVRRVPLPFDPQTVQRRSAH
eukprot:TRINITY_DN34217_c0_g1_i1.p1 TRINITY_DN34217_c0_g1~~TRINITY_DN34217_c0_g1_i1.p1  ORF type:complete len:117 (+),score=15.39 TRINITY_DN34217_c0_g1_i1:45-353(+)